MIGPRRAHVLVPLPCLLSQVVWVAQGIPDDVQVVVRTVVVGDQRMLLFHDAETFDEADWTAAGTTASTAAGATAGTAGPRV